MKKKVVLAYSGGLDTSYCVKYLNNELDQEIHSVLVNTGGFSDEELHAVEKRAYELGVKSHKTINELENYYQTTIKYLVFGNILKNNTYPLSVSAERTSQAIATANYAKSIGADAVAHGSTGAGNDQVRFDMVFQALVPEMEIITPIRDLQLSREEEIEYLKKQGVNTSWEKAKYSINQGLWGTSVGGVETLTTNKPLPEEAYPSQLEKSGTEKVELQFEKGELIGINGKELKPVDAIIELNKIASAYAIGRDVHVGDTIIGIKGRVGFEAAAPLIIIKAHHTLEKHTLTKWQQYWKEQLANWYGMMLHEAQYLDPVMRDIEGFLDDTQKNVTGKVIVTLAPYRFSIDGIESKQDLMNSGFGDYGEIMKGWSGDDVRGFTKIMGNQTTIYNKVNND
ncbi:MAG: argininosuccinate synthase domain-containing protein [Bacteroidota bacterium]